MRRVFQSAGTRVSGCAFLDGGTAARDGEMAYPRSLRARNVRLAKRCKLLISFRAWYQDRAVEYDVFGKQLAHRAAVGLPDSRSLRKDALIPHELCYLLLKSSEGLSSRPINSASFGTS